MSTNRAAKQLMAALFLVAGSFMAMNLLIQRAPSEEWGLTLIILLIGAAFLVWLWFDHTNQQASMAAPESSIVPAAPKPIVIVPAPTAAPTPPPVETVAAPVDVPAVSKAAEKAPVVEQAAPPITELAVEAPGPVIDAAKAGEPVAETQVAEAMAAPPAEPEPQIVPPSAAAVSSTASAEPDDLTRVEGIGPKYRDALLAAGIDTFDTLASTSQEKLEEIIKAAGMRRAASMATWREQAALAAKNDWEGLAKLQTELSGGRRS